MGFNKFKHLQKNECCQCIRDHLLPHRSVEDIKRQINANCYSDQRQVRLKELRRQQKQLNTIIDYNFNKQIHYKSPYQQAEYVQLPPMYTVSF